MDPLSPLVGFGQAFFLYQSRQFDGAIEQCRETLELEPDYPLALLTLAEALLQQGKLEEAVAVWKQLYLSVGDLESARVLDEAVVREGPVQALAALGRHLVAQREFRFVMPVDIAVLFAGAGEGDEAFHWLELGIGERDPNILLLRLDPVFDPLRPDPRFEELVRRLELPS